MSRRFPAVVLIALAASSSVGEEPALDAFTGLRMTGDWELVRNNCVACHSAKLVTQQRGSKAQWLKMIRWMQESQNLWQFDPETESRIVEYLARNYPPRQQSRRSPLDPSLLPVNPFTDETAN